MNKTGWKVRVRYQGLQRDFGKGTKDEPYLSRKAIEKRATQLRERYSKLPGARISITHT